MVEGSAPAQAGFDAASQNTLNGAPVEIADYESLSDCLCESVVSQCGD